MSEQLLPDETSVHAYVGRICFKTGPPEHVGGELEWLLSATSDPIHPVAPETLDDLIRESAPMPGGSRVTLEPGGQVELSSPVAENLTRCWQGLRADVGRLDHLLAERDLIRQPVALDPVRPPRRMLRTPRYDAMQDYFDCRGDAGMLMMTSTASVQVNLDAGADRADVHQRWRLLHAIGPTLVAAFANSPLHRGRPTGWKSARQRILLAADSARMAVPQGRDPASAWAEYALSAPVMVCPRPDGWLASPGYTFREWVTGVAGRCPPTEDDLAYHLTTLFPPVRPRGWMEIRYLDTPPAAWWPVPLAVVTALVNDPIAADTAMEATEAALDWEVAARLGPAEPELHGAGVRCFDAALSALSRMGADPDLVALVSAFVERFVSRRRCPADDVCSTQTAPADHRFLATAERP
jgi:glutamate--cysteine ligase